MNASIVAAVLLQFLIVSNTLVQTMSESSKPPNRFLVIIPGFGGNLVRESYIRQSLQFYPAHNWDCLLFVYNSDARSGGRQVLRHKSNASLPCELIASPGKFVEHLLHVRPEFVMRRKYQLIVVHVDDAVFMPPFEFSWEAIHHFMTTASIDSISPRVNQAGLVRLMNPRSNSTKLSETCPGLYPATSGNSDVGESQSSCGWMGYDVPQVEIFIQVFLPLAWVCFWDMLDATVNAEGWGYDVCFKTVCNATIVLLDDWHAMHTKPNGSRTDGREAMHQMDELFQKRAIAPVSEGGHVFVKSCTRSKEDYTSY